MSVNESDGSQRLNLTSDGITADSPISRTSLV